MDIKFLSFPTPHLQPDCCCRIYQYWIRIRIWTNQVRIEFASYWIPINPIHWQASAENWMTNHEVWWEGKIQFKLRVEKKTLKRTDNGRGQQLRRCGRASSLSHETTFRHTFDPVSDKNHALQLILLFVGHTDQHLLFSYFGPLLSWDDFYPLLGVRMSSSAVTFVPQTEW